MVSGSDADAGAFEDGMVAARTGDQAKAAELWTPLASQGTADEQLRIALIYLLGPSGELPTTPKNDAEAAKWFLLAAKQGLSEAQLYIGAMYNEGRGVARDRVHAYMWLTLSGENVVRDKAATTMSANQIMLGEELAMRCKANLKDCD